MNRAYKEQKEGVYIQHTDFKRIVETNNRNDTGRLLNEEDNGVQGEWKFLRLGWRQFEFLVRCLGTFREEERV